MMSLLVAAGVAPLAGGDPERYVALALLLALMVGVIQLTLGLLRFGFLTNFLSHPVLAGFTSAAAIIIGASQLRHLVGVDLPNSNHVHRIVLWPSAATWLRSTSLTLASGPDGIAPAGGAEAMAVHVSGRPGRGGVVHRRCGPLWGLESAGLRTVGQIPGGLPRYPSAIPTLDPAAILALLPVALAIALVGFMESIAVAKVYATRSTATHGPEPGAGGAGRSRTWWVPSSGPSPPRAGSPAPR
jgi:sulfate permease, SulP family